MLRLADLTDTAFPGWKSEKLFSRMPRIANSRLRLALTDEDVQPAASAEAAAKRTIEERAVLFLSARETESFVDAILHPADPGPVLRAAARCYKNLTLLPGR